MFLVYNFLLTIFAPIWLPWMLWRSSRRREKPNWAERTGRPGLPRKGGKKRIWVHAVSVGEVIAAEPVLRELRILEPSIEVVLSVTTSSGHRTARELRGSPYDHLIYFPIDVARFQLAALARVKPDVVAIMETELWLNFLWAAKAVGAATLLVNGRISERSFQRGRWLRPYYRTLFKFVNSALMQNEDDAIRARTLGAQRVEVIGNTKFDQALAARANQSEVRADLGLPDGLPVIVVGSTRGRDEEELVIEALSKIGQTFALVYAPRHLERAEEVRQRLTTALGEPAMRSRQQAGRVLLLDTYGELARAYAAADIAIVGGGFGPYGGQNLLQALAQGKPVIHGPNMDNFREVAAAADAAGATIVAATSEDLRAAIERLMHDAVEAAEMASAANRYVALNAGASKAYAQRLLAAAGISNNKVNPPG